MKQGALHQNLKRTMLKPLLIINEKLACQTRPPRERLQDALKIDDLPLDKAVTDFLAATNVAGGNDDSPQGHEEYRRAAMNYASGSDGSPQDMAQGHADLRHRADEIGMRWHTAVFSSATREVGVPIVLPPILNMMIKQNILVNYF